MRVKHFTFTEYHIAFRAPMRTARAILTVRRGFLVAAHGRNGEVGVGECATLPEFGTEGHHEASRLLAQLSDYYTDQEIPDSFEEFPQWHEQAGLLSAMQPATIFGVECALLGLKSAIQRPDILSGAAILEMTTPFSVNSLITGNNVDELVESAQQRQSVGFHTLKLKVGVLPAETEIRAIRLIRMALPDVKIRLDANCAWTAQQAIDFCNQIETADIEYIEDPVHSWDIEALARFREQCSMRIAVDEFFQSSDFLGGFANWNLFDVLVLKPVRIGSICWIDQIQQAARDHGVRTVFTSMYDTSLGLACTLEIMQKFADHDIAHGLDTARLLASDTLIHHLIPDRGKLRVFDPASLPGMIKESYRKQLMLPA